MDRPIADSQRSAPEAIGADIDRIAAECGANGWNGEAESLAVTPAAVEQAKRLVGLLDVTQFPLPEVIPEADGDLALEWHRDDTHWLLASVRPDGHVNYACRLGEGNRATGTSPISAPFAQIVEAYLTLVHAESS